MLVLNIYKNKTKLRIRIPPSDKEEIVEIYVDHPKNNNATRLAIEAAKEIILDRVIR